MQKVIKLALVAASLTASMAWGYTTDTAATFTTANAERGFDYAFCAAMAHTINQLGGPTVDHKKFGEMDRQLHMLSMREFDDEIEADTKYKQSVEVIKATIHDKHLTAPHATRSLSSDFATLLMQPIGGSCLTALEWEEHNAKCLIDANQC